MPAVFVYAGNGPWWLAPLLCFAPLVLQLEPSLLLGPFAAFAWVLREVLQPFLQPEEWRRNTERGMPLQSRLASPQRRAAAGVGVLDLALALVLPALLLFAAVWAATQVRQHGWRRVVRRIFSRPGDRARAAPGQRGRGQHSREQRFEDVIKTLHQLPAEEFAGREELMALSAHDLKARLRLAKLGVPGGAVEKRELVEALLAGRASSDAACSICCEDYAAGDVLRRLRCRHSFHLECIDRWLLSSTDFSRPVACPMCNQPLTTGGGAG